MNYSLRSKNWIFSIILCLLITISQCWAQTYVAKQSANAAIVPGTTDIGNHCDDCTTVITLPFNYQFYDTVFTSVIVGSNGTLQFVSNNATPENSTLPAAGFNYAIFPYWTDLDTGSAASGQGIFTSTSGSAPNRIFNIEWRTQICCGLGAPTDIFEVRLYEGQFKFEVIYGVMSFSGNFETSGAQKDNTDFTLFQYNTPGTLYNGLKLNYALQPTAAAVALGGRVMTANGSGISDVLISMTDSNGVIKTVTTDSSGFYNFAGVNSGETYVIAAQGSRIRFAQSSRIVNLNEEMTDVNFIGNFELKSRKSKQKF